MNNLVRKITANEIQRVSKDKNIQSVVLKSYVEISYLTANKDQRIFRGIVIAIEKKGTSSSITVLTTHANPNLKLTYKFLYYSPNVIDVKLIRKFTKKPRRAKLFYFEKLHGKKARI
jgi:ribosomal protein L19